MNKFFFSILAIFAITLTACGATSAATSSNNNLPAETQLAVGTLKLAETDQDVSTEQATELVVYWETYKELSQSDTAAQEEFDGLLAQIRETMASGQMQAIINMNITQQDVFASMQGVTVASNNSGSSTVSVPSGSSDGGGMPAGGPPTDGAGAPPDGGMGADMSGAAPVSGTNQSQSTATGSGPAGIARIPSALVEAVIQSLQRKIAAA